MGTILLAYTFKMCYINTFRTVSYIKFFSELPEFPEEFVILISKLPQVNLSNHLSRFGIEINGRLTFHRGYASMMKTSSA